VPTTHRVLSVRNENGTTVYTTKGDANEEEDPQEVARREVIGKVFLSVPYAGFVLDFARQPLGFALLIGLPAFLVIVSEFAAIAQEVFRLRRRVPVRRPARGQLTPRARTPRPAHSTEYVRLFAMDDIFIPARIFADSMRSPQKARVRNMSAHYKGALTSSIAVVCIALVSSFGNAGATLSYFRDTETSTGNTFTAGTWPLESLLLGESGGGAGFAFLFVEDISEDTEDAEEVVDEGESNEEMAQEPEDENTNEAVEEADERVRGARDDREAREEREIEEPTLPEAGFAVEEGVSQEQPVTEESVIEEPALEEPVLEESEESTPVLEPEEAPQEAPAEE